MLAVYQTENTIQIQAPNSYPFYHNCKNVNTTPEKTKAAVKRNTLPEENCSVNVALAGESRFFVYGF